MPRSAENAAVVRFLEGNHSHSDIGGLLESSGRRLRTMGVVVDTTLGREPFPALGLSYKGRFFAASKGMQNVTLRLPKDHADLLVSYGAFLEKEIGFPCWVSFPLISFNLNLDDWVEEAFRFSDQEMQ